MKNKLIFFKRFIAVMAVICMICISACDKGNSGETDSSGSGGSGTAEVWSCHSTVNVLQDKHVYDSVKAMRR